MSHWTALVDPVAVIPREVREVAKLSSLDKHVKAKPAKVARKRPAKRLPPKRTRSQYYADRWENSLQFQLMKLLTRGPIEEVDFRRRARDLARAVECDSKYPVPKALRVLVKKGLIVSEFRLTEAGRKELGLEPMP